MMWKPGYYEGKRIPTTATVYEGALTVPAYLPPHHLAYMEQEFRSVLWPPAKQLERERVSREFRWDNDGRQLHYRIIDMPITRRKEE